MPSKQDPRYVAMRQWLVEHGYDVPPRGPIPRYMQEAFWDAMVTGYGTQNDSH